MELKYNDEWKNFIKTYDTKYLNNLSTEFIRNKFQKIKHSHGLKRILNLYLMKPQIKKCNILTDVLSLSYHTSKEYNKNIYIFGENHKPEDKCSLNIKDKCNVYDFIMDNILHIPKMIDVFLELPLIDKNLQFYLPEIKSPGTLDKFKINLLNCLNPIKNCKYPNIRFHNTDIRQFETEKELPFIMKFIRDYFAIYNTLDEKEINFEKYHESVIRLNNTLKGINESEYNTLLHFDNHEQLFQYLLNVYNKFKLQKQVDNISNQKVKDILLTFLYDNIKTINLKTVEYKYIKIMSNMPLDKIPTDKQIKIFTKYLNNILLALEIPFMDVYLLARMFRKFKQIKYQNSNEPENIIIYVGNYHANNYRFILSKLNFKQEFITNSKSDEFCIDINKLPQPLFT